MVPDVCVLVVRMGEIEVPLPRYQTAGSSGMDLHAALTAPVVIAPLHRLKVPTGIAISLPPQFEGQVRPRSGLAARSGLTVLNAPGTVDSDYRGEIQVLLVNLGSEPATLSPMERIAQLVIAPVARAELLLRVELDVTARGEGGYGSTG